MKLLIRDKTVAVTLNRTDLTRLVRKLDKDGERKTIYTVTEDHLLVIIAEEDQLPNPQVPLLESTPVATRRVQ